MSALDRQIGGDHYKQLSPQPVEVSFAWKLPFPEGSVLKYLFRWVVKHNREDLLKAQHWIDMILENDAKERPEASIRVGPPTLYGPGGAGDPGAATTATGGPGYKSGAF